MSGTRRSTARARARAGSSAPPAALQGNTSAAATSAGATTIRGSIMARRIASLAGAPSRAFLSYAHGSTRREVDDGVSHGKEEGCACGEAAQDDGAQESRRSPDQEFEAVEAAQPGDAAAAHVHAGPHREQPRAQHQFLYRRAGIH